MRILLSVLLTLCAASASAQTMGQGTAAPTTDVRAWPIKVVFGDAHIDPRLVTVQNTTLAVKELRASSSSVASVAGSATSVSCLASNANRLGATIYNDSAADLYVKLGATASTTSFTVKVFQDGLFVIPFGYTGVIDCIWSSASGAARTLEVSQ